ncbi:MAG: Hsp70 family protein, partial [Pseudonocardiaceae bacterium]
MGYWLGIDVGSTVTAAAVCWEEGPAEVVSLGSNSAVVPSVVFLGEHDQVEVGEAALRRAVTDPDRVVRGFTGRIGDQVPMVIGGQTYTAAQLAAMLISWVVDQVSTRQGGRAEGIVITHPASWGDYKRAVLATSLVAAGLGRVRFCAEPEAVAAGCAAGQPIASGHTIAVYDLGGTTFDATVIRSTGAGGFTVLGQPQVLDQLGGVDFDDAVFGHVLAAVPGLTELDADNPTTLAAMAALRRECSQATQVLSADTEVTIPVTAPGIQTQVRLHRAEFDDMIRPQLSETLQALRRALHTAQVQPQDLDAVLLVGGSCRIPLVAQVVSTHLDQPLTIDADPATVIARGAAALAVPTPRADDIADAPALLSPPVPAEPDGPTRQPERPSLTAIPLDVEPTHSQRRRASSRSMKRAALAGSLALLAAAASVPLFIARGDSIPQTVAGTQAPRTPNTVAATGNSNDQRLPTGSSTAPILAVPVTAPNHSAGDAASAGTHPVHTAGLQTAGAGTAVPVNNSAGGGGTTSPAGGGGT